MEPSVHSLTQSVTDLVAYLREQRKHVHALTREVTETKQALKALQEERDNELVGIRRFTDGHRTPDSVLWVKKNVTHLTLDTPFVPCELTQLPCLRTLELEKEIDFSFRSIPCFNVPQVTKLIVRDYQPVWKWFPNLEHLVFDHAGFMLCDDLLPPLSEHLCRPWKLKRIDMPSYGPEQWKYDRLKQFCDDHQIELCVTNIMAKTAEEKAPAKEESMPANKTKTIDEAMTPPLKDPSEDPYALFSDNQIHLVLSPSHYEVRNDE
jgi:hypothetical protein